MAGPYRLAPQEVQGNIPTWGAGKQTKVHVDTTVDGGNFEMTAGGSASEVNELQLGRNTFERSFGGVYLAVKNLTQRDITVTTE